jgi:methyl-accepting chemotaxis protein
LGFIKKHKRFIKLVAENTSINISRLIFKAKGELKMKNLKISTKLIIAFLVILVGTASIGIYGVFSISSIASSGKLMYTNDLLAISSVADLTEDFYTLRVGVLKAAYEDFTQDGAASLQKTADDASVKLDSGFDEYAKTITDKQDEANLATLKSLFQDYEKQVAQVIAIVQASDSTKLKVQLTSTAAVAQKVEDQLNVMQVSEKDSAKAAMDSNDQLDTMSTWIMIAIMAVVSLIGILLAVIVAKGITKPVQQLVDASKKIAAGDMDVQLVVDSKDEMGVLAKSFEEMVASIRKLIEDVNMLADAAGNGQLSTRADTEQHQGDYRKVVAGFNKTLDVIMEPLDAVQQDLESLAKGERRDVLDAELYSGYFKGLVSDMAALRLTVRMLVNESTGLASSALEGDLRKRADSNKVQGLFRTILEGFNDTLDAVINPVNESAQVLSEVAKGNLSVRVEGDYRGDHAIIKDALNETIDSMNRYIQEISKILSAMAAGNLDMEITADYKGDFVALKSSINHIIASLNEVLTEIRLTADQVSAGSDQVSAGNQAVSQGATEQASSIEELTVTMGHIAAQTNQNVETAKESKASAVRSKQTAEEADTQMKEMLSSMEQINESSESISKIIKVIDDIAFQTNILALNAAVEAARAGAHGKGFAVVAEEVRSLAGRSANAAKETAELIEGSVKKIGEGAKLADRTAEALKLIVQGAMEAEILEEKILSASEEQAAGIRQVSQGIEQMSMVVQTNSAAAQEGAAASQELSGQAVLLKEKIEMFTLRK